MANYSRSFIDRFNAKFSPRFNGCWEWRASKTHNGYGRIWYRNRTLRANRVSLEIHRGPIPIDLCVLHRCDNPGCVNPDHLFLGTQQDNVDDCKSKKRRGRPNVKLTDVEVRLIRHLYFAERKAQLELAAFFGVGQTNISRIVRGKTWING